MIKRRPNHSLLLAVGGALLLSLTCIVLDGYTESPAEELSSVLLTEAREKGTSLPGQLRRAARCFPLKEGKASTVANDNKQRRVTPAFGFHWGRHHDHLGGPRMSCCMMPPIPPRIRQEGPVVDGKKHGKFAIYWDDKLREEGRFEADQRIGVWRGYRADGTPSFVAHYADGRKHGRYQEFDESGVTTVDGCFVHGHKSGSWTHWWKAGVPRRRQFFDDRSGEAHGPFFAWYQNGLVRCHNGYFLGNPHGKWRDYHESGGLAETGTYVHGSCEGEFKRWHKNGKPAYAGRFKSNRPQGRHAWFHSDGGPAAVVQFAGGERDGVLRSWFEGGHLHLEYTYRKGQRHGLSREWSSDGVLIKETEFARDEKHGIERWWTDDGVLIREASYDMGKEHGWVRTWYDDGTPSSLSFLQNDELEGVSTSWNEKGYIENQDHYKAGLQHGPSYMWHENGQLARLNHYQEGELHGLAFHWEENGALVSRLLYRNDEVVEWRR